MCTPEAAAGQAEAEGLTFRYVAGESLAWGGPLDWVPSVMASNCHVL